jgi:hypothetical protein
MLILHSTIIYIYIDTHYLEAYQIIPSRFLFIFGQIINLLYHRH